MDKEDVVFIYTLEYHSAIKKNEIFPFATTGIELESIMLSKISQRKQIPYDFIHMWNLRNKTNEHRWGKKERGKPRNRLLTIENKLMVTGGEVGGGQVKWVVGVKEDTYDEHWMLYVSEE